jgi:hypothetical protein
MDRLPILLLSRIPINSFDASSGKLRSRRPQTGYSDQCTLPLVRMCCQYEDGDNAQALTSTELLNEVLDHNNVSGLDELRNTH